MTESEKTVEHVKREKKKVAKLKKKILTTRNLDAVVDEDELVEFDEG